MITISKGEAPRELVDNIRALKLAPVEQLSYDALRSETKDAIRCQLIKEQGGLCAYCMRRISHSHEAPIKIEHRIPRHSGQGDAAGSDVDYQNLYVVCDGGERQPLANQTCDTHKRNAAIEVDPLKKETIDCIEYASDGRIYSKNEAIHFDLNETLNLNCARSSLIQGRKSALDALNRKLNASIKNRGHRAYRHHCEKELARLEAQSEKRQEYLGVLVWALKRKVNRR